MKLKYYLFPSETNNYKPWITSNHSLLFFIAIVWSLRLAVPASLGFADSFLDTSDLMARINNERSQRNIATLVTNDKLIAAAKVKADDMLDRSYFSHIDPSGNYVWPIIEKQGYLPYSNLGENLAMDFTSAEDAVAAWMNSPTHRQNILNTNFKDQGLSIASGLYEPDHRTNILVSLFGTLTKKSGSTVNQVQASTDKDAQVSIAPDAKLSMTEVSGHKIVSIDIGVKGDAKLVTAVLKGQTITLLSQSGRYQGKFTFNLTEDLSGQKVTIEARDEANRKVTSAITVNDTSAKSTVANNESIASAIPVSAQAKTFEVLRYIFGAMSVVYLGFLVTDEIMIRRAHIQRPGIHVAPQIAIFLIVAFVNFFAKI